MMARPNFRELREFLVPAWLSREPGGKVLHAFLALVDLSVAKLRLAVEARWPQYVGATLLAEHGRERGIIRGRDETDEHYASRLVAWRYPRGHRTRGSAYALLEQIQEYFGGDSEAWTIDAGAQYHHRTADGSQERGFVNIFAWDSDPGWARFWVVVDGGPFSEQPDFGNPALWGGELGNDSYSIGVAGLSAADASAIRGLLSGSRPWRPAGTRGEWWAIALDGTGLPTTWSLTSNEGRWATISAGEYVRGRDATYRYVSFAPERNNVYTGDATYRDPWPTIPLPSGATYSPDETYPATVPLPSGGNYAGDDSNYPATVQLPDDGDTPA